MTTVRIPLTEQVAQQFRQLSRLQRQAIKDKVASMLVQELEQVGATQGTLNNFQEVMQISNEDMRLTFGDDYLTQRHWLVANE